MGTIRGMDINEIRENLLTENQRLENLREGIREGSSLDESQQDEPGGETSTVDQHDADIASEQQQREVDLSMLEQVEAELVDIEHALQKVDQGTYGTCEVCKQPIDEPRLEALPATRFCLEHQTAVERDRPRGVTDPTSPLVR